jgi:hypothetical protein
MRLDLCREQGARRRWNFQLAAAFLEPVEVKIEPTDAAVMQRHGFEQTVAVGEPAVGGIDAGRSSIHEPERIHVQRMRG